MLPKGVGTIATCAKPYWRLSKIPAGTWIVRLMQLLQGSGYRPARDRRVDRAVEVQARAADGAEPVDQAAVATDEELVEVPARRAERAGLGGGPAIERMSRGTRDDLLASQGNVMLNLVSQNRLMSSLLPGSCPPKSFDGTPRTTTPLSL